MIHNVVLEVLVKPEQLSVMEQLQKVFPVITHYRHLDFEYHLLVVIDKGPRYAEQYRFLHEHGLTYVDVATQRDRLLHEFFANVTLQDRPIKHITLSNTPADPSAHTVEIDNGAHRITLVLPPFWLPRYAIPS